MATRSKNKKVTIKVNEENPEPVEIIAKAIIDVSDAFAKINNSRLSRRVIVLLIHDRVNVNIRDIETILDIVPRLKDIYIKKPAK